MSGNRWNINPEDLEYDETRKGYWLKSQSRSDHHSPVPDAHMEQGSRHESLGEKEAPSVDLPCCIHVHSYRKRLTDPDGICGKYVIDGLIHAGILPDDSAQEVHEVSFSQEQADTECTVIEIYSVRVEKEFE
jgi:hypothetical protein